MEIQSKNTQLVLPRFLRLFGIPDWCAQRAYFHRTDDWCLPGEKSRPRIFYDGSDLPALPESQSWRLPFLLSFFTHTSQHCSRAVAITTFSLPEFCAFFFPPPPFLGSVQKEPTSALSIGGAMRQRRALCRWNDRGTATSSVDAISVPGTCSALPLSLSPSPPLPHGTKRGKQGKLQRQGTNLAHEDGERWFRGGALFLGSITANCKVTSGDMLKPHHNSCQKKSKHGPGSRTVVTNKEKGGREEGDEGRKKKKNKQLLDRGEASFRHLAGTLTESASPCASCSLSPPTAPFLRHSSSQDKISPFVGQPVNR